MTPETIELIAYLYGAGAAIAGFAVAFYLNHIREPKPSPCRIVAVALISLALLIISHSAFYVDTPTTRVTIRFLAYSALLAAQLLLLGANGVHGIAADISHWLAPPRFARRPTDDRPTPPADDPAPPAARDGGPGRTALDTRDNDHTKTHDHDHDHTTAAGHRSAVRPDDDGYAPVTRHRYPRDRNRRGGS